MKIKIKIKETIPINFIQSNTTLSGTGEVGDLPVYRDRDNIISCWKIPFLRRLRVFITGNIWVCVKNINDTHPPLYVESKVFEKQ